MKYGTDATLRDSGRVRNMKFNFREGVALKGKRSYYKRILNVCFLNGLLLLLLFLFFSLFQLFHQIAFALAVQLRSVSVFTKLFNNIRLI